MTHHVVHESFKNNISNNTHNIAQGGHPVFRGANVPSKCNPDLYRFFKSPQITATYMIRQFILM